MQFLQPASLPSQFPGPTLSRPLNLTPTPPLLFSWQIQKAVASYSCGHVSSVYTPSGGRWSPTDMAILEHVTKEPPDNIVIKVRRDLTDFKLIMHETAKVRVIYFNKRVTYKSVTCPVTSKPYTLSTAVLRDDSTRFVSFTSTSVLRIRVRLNKVRVIYFNKRVTYKSVTCPVTSKPYTLSTAVLRDDSTRFVSFTSTSVLRIRETLYFVHGGTSRRLNKVRVIYFNKRVTYKSVTCPVTSKPYTLSTAVLREERCVGGSGDVAGGGAKHRNPDPHNTTRTGYRHVNTDSVAARPHLTLTLHSYVVGLVGMLY
ncbi:hypothetical protein J6590_023159 [Homalodisca vitripennis]|nr:hypothetical protein J6590_023159 [Homalodisca vitripennis]